MPEAYLRVGIDGTLAEQGARMVRRSLEEIYNSANQATSSVGRLKSTLNDLGYSAKGLRDAFMGLVSAFALVRVAEAVFNGIVASVKAAFNAVDSFKVNVASLSATVMTFMDKTRDANMAESWRRANEYAKNLVPTLEIISAKMLMTGQQATLMFTELAKSGNFLDVFNKKAVEGFVALGNTISILTQGQDPMRQIMTEVRALMLGVAQPGSMLIRMLLAIDPQLKEHLRIWKEQGKTLEEIGKLLVGFESATADLSTAWMAVSSTTMTYVQQILRSAMADAYSSIMGFMAKLNAYLLENKDTLSSGLYKFTLLIQGTIETISNLLVPFGPTFKLLAELTGMIAQGLGIIAYVLLPPISERLAAVVQSMLQWTNVFADLFTAAAKALTGDFDGAVAYLKSSWNNVEQSGRYLGNAFASGFGDEITKRMTEFDKKFNSSAKAFQTPLGAAGTPAEDKTLSAGLRLKEMQMRSELDLLKRMGDLQKGYYDFQYSQGLIDLKNYYEKRRDVIVRTSEAELAVVQDQIAEAENSRNKINASDSNAEKRRVEFSTKIVELEARAQAIRLDTANKLMTLEHSYVRESEQNADSRYEAEMTLARVMNNTVQVTQVQIQLDETHRRGLDAVTRSILSQADSLKVLRAEYDQAHANDDLKNRIASVDIEDDPYKSQMESIRQRYESEKEWIAELRDWKISNAQDATNEVNRLNLLEAAQTAEIREFKEREYKRGAAAFSDSMNVMSEVMMEGNQEQFEQGKKMSIAAALISTYLGAQQAFTSLSSIPYVGVALGIAAAAAAIAAGLNRVAKIESQTFQGRAQGGPVGAGETYWVGENGPELVTFGASGNVTSNSELARVQREQLEATRELKKSMDNNSLAVERVADGFTKISGSLSEMAAYFIKLSGVNAPEVKTGFWRTLSDNFNEIVTNALSFLGNYLTFDLRGMIADLKESLKDGLRHVFGIGSERVVTGGGIYLGYAGGEVIGSQYRNVHKEGGYFGRDKDTTDIYALPSSTLKLLNDYATKIQNSAILAARVLGVGTAGITGASVSSAPIDLTGLTEEQASKKVEEWLVKLGNAFAEGVTGLEQFTEIGENSFDALIRLATALQTVNESAELLGTALFDSSLKNANLASQLIDKMGGLEEYSDKVSKFFNLFYTDFEQSQMIYEQSLRQVQLEFNKMGGAIPATVEGFRDLVNSLDLTTQSGQDAYASLMSVAEAAGNIYKYEKELRNNQLALDYDVTARMMRVTGRGGAADLFELWVEQQRELSEAQEKGIDVTDLLTVQSLEYADAVERSSKTISEANRKLIEQTKQALLDYISDQAAILNTLKSIKTGPLSQLSPEAAYLQAKERFANASISDLPDAATALLEASKNYNASGAAFQEDLQVVLHTLASAVGLDSDPTLEGIQTQIDLLEQIKTAINTGNIDQLANLQGILGNNAALNSLIQAYLDANLTAISTMAGIAADAAEEIAKAEAARAAAAAAAAQADAAAQANAEKSKLTLIAYQNAIGEYMYREANGWSSAQLRPYLVEIQETYQEAYAAGHLRSELDKRLPIGVEPPRVTAYAEGTDYVPYDMYARIHEGEVIIDKASANILRSYGIRVSGGNDAVVAELREQNKHLAALVRVSQYGFSKSIDVNEKQAGHLSTMATKTRLDSAK